MWRGDLSPLGCAAAPQKPNAINMAQRGACVQGERPPAPTLSVGAGLLAKASGQLASGLNVPPRASPPPPPTWGAHKYCIQPNSPVGASLLAMTPAQPPRVEGAYSRSAAQQSQNRTMQFAWEKCRGLLLRPAGASPPATGVSVEPNIQPNATHCGSRLELAKAAGQLASILNVPPSSRASPLPHRVVAEHSLCNSPIPCGSKACSRKRRVSLHQC